jgi:pimeloyl-ACP methyl ester carboxylesterase
MSSRPRYRAWARMALVLAVTASTVTLGPAAAPSSAGSPSGGLTWTECGDGFQCASVAVPLNYSDPSSRTIQIGLTRMPAKSGASKGSVVVNAGTQNGGGSTLVRFLGAAFAGLNQDFDIVGLDTRGVGTSTPQVRCTTYEENRQVEAPVSASQTPADRDQRVREAAWLADKCQERSGDLLPYLSSTTSARDLDRVRAALGETALRYIGLSGGSILGQNYLAMFPRRVAAMVLDSPLDPERFLNDPLAFDIDQMVATERTMDTFFRWCRSTPALCAFGDGDPRGAFERLLAKTRQNRLDNPGRWDIVTDGALVDLVSGAMLFPQQWPGLSQQLAAMAAQAVPTMPLSTGDDRTFAEYYSQNCLDRRFPRDLAAYDRQLRASVKAAPYLGGRFGYAELKCQQWPANPAERFGGPWLNPAKRPVLVLAATDDPLAPFHGAQRVAHRLHADLVTLRASGHLQLGRTPCADDKVRAFLLTGEAPRRTACTVPLPGR